ncbi:hypothetical protein IV01_06900 [Pseudomonas syringae]|uniref:Uncharacterized protein n=1 Tax=Pseudomonas syringae TaxID=317 RepID=A0A085VN89_PSESX|nr:hypothetical protein IV01_06900 [Pseudomonas syringae]
MNARPYEVLCVRTMHCVRRNPANLKWRDEPVARLTISLQMASMEEEQLSVRMRMGGDGQTLIDAPSDINEPPFAERID